ncbi:MAG: transporter permease [Rhodoglobus sp.]|nr:transporter permease [Rhodoglobus sp.]
MNRFSAREHVPSILVATLSAAFGISLLQVTGVLATAMTADDLTGSSATVAYLLSILAIVFIVIATYVSAIVTANTFSTIIAGRTRTIALLRLIGASARGQRAAVSREGLVVGLIGAALGAVVGTAATAGLAGIGIAAGFLPAHPYSYFEPVIILPIVTVVLTTWLASWVGSRRVLVVSPMQATGAAQELSNEEAAGKTGRNAAALVLFIIGAVLLALGIVVGLINPLGVLIGLFGGIFSFTGLVLGAQRVMPPALRLVGRAFGRSAPARLAAENALRYPERSSRTTIGLVIGVTLVTMFSVAIGSYQDMIHRAQQDRPELFQGVDQMLLVTVVVFSILTGFSALIAAIGMVNNLSLSVLQRTRELGLLRALGFTAGQVRRMILAESAQLTLAATLVGLVLGVVYGWAGAQSLLGGIQETPRLVVPTVPFVLIAVVVVAAGVLTVAASIVPSRRATRVAPVAALAVE